MKKRKVGGCMLRKTYVLDTNVLIQAPYALECFQNNKVVLPIVILEELDSLKKSEGEKGSNAREVIRKLENLRHRGDLLEGVPLNGDGWIQIEKNCINIELPDFFMADKSDNRILKVCKSYMEREEQVILVTKDIVLRLKAQMMGICSEDFTTEQVGDGKLQYTGRMACYAPELAFKEFKKRGIDRSVLYLSDEHGNITTPEFVENQFVMIQADQSGKKTQLGRVEGTKVVPLEYAKKAPFGITPRNVGQYFLQEALMLPYEKAPLVIVKGMAGTAKTFYSLAVGLEKLLNQNKGEYRRILICRPNAQFDTDIGYLPGDEQEKISPLLRPIMDNLEILVDSDEQERFKNEDELKDKLDELFERGIIQAEALNFIRGRSIINTYLIIDEAQNMTPNQVKGIITRAGKGTKIILLGDPNQIDKPFLDERTNGISYASEHMKGSEYCYQITMSASECERSDLAMDGIKRL